MDEYTDILEIVHIATALVMGEDREDIEMMIWQIFYKQPMVKE